MLAKEAVSARLNSEAGISYTEFSYQILQAHDYLQLFRRHGVTLQTGGSDQWGNLTAGIDLVRRTEGARVHALSTPLVTKSDGTKFGKSEGGAVWLDPSLTSPYAFFQFWLNADDADARSWLPLYSERPAEEVEALIAESIERPAARTAQRENKFAHDEELRFKPTARRNKLFGLWAAEQLGKSGADAEAYAKTVVLADFEEAGDADVIRKVRQDLEAGGKSIGDAELNRALTSLMGTAIEQIQAGR